MPRRVCVVITARPSYSRVRSALAAIHAHPDLELLVVVSASALLTRYSGVGRYIEEDGFPIAARVHTILEGGDLATMVKTTGLALVELSGILQEVRPDIVVTVADRYETMATAMAAAYMNIPVAHVQGGELSGSIDEKVRHAVTKLADLHLVATRPAAERVIRMGEDPDTVFHTGCPSIDLARGILDRPELDFDPVEKYAAEGGRVSLSDRYLVVLQHPVTTEYAQASQQILETLRAVRDVGLPAAWFWPNIDAGSQEMSAAIETFCERERPDNICFFRDVAPPDFLRLLYNSQCLVGNSSAGIRECAFLGIPVVNIGARQAGRDRAGNVVDVGYCRQEISTAILRQAAKGRLPSNCLYGDGRAGARIAEVLAGAPLCIEKRLRP